MSGTWYLAYTSLIPKSTYLKDTTCAVGYYSAVGEDALLKGLPAVPTIDVYNAATKDGETIGGTGKLWQFLPKKPGNLVVTMDLEKSKGIPASPYLGKSPSHNSLTSASCPIPCHIRVDH